MGIIDTDMQNEYVAATNVIPTCPLCHTSDPAMTTAALRSGAYWRCARCGQMWDALRLQTAAAYATGATLQAVTRGARR